MTKNQVLKDKKRHQKNKQDKRRDKAKEALCNAIHKAERLVIQKEHKADALALTAEEGRGKLRKAAGRSKQPMIRRYPNGATRMAKSHALLYESNSITGGTR